MFFHRIERLNNEAAMKETMKKALEDQYYTIIPLVNPNRAAGKFLMDQKQSAVISDYSGTNVNIFYTSEALRSEFPQFIDHILLEVRNMSGEEVKEPGLLIFFPGKEQLVTLELPDEDDMRKFRAFLFNVIDALESGDRLNNINRLKDKADIIHIEENKSHLIKELHLYVAKFFL
jgi:hypothetical protein